MLFRSEKAITTLNLALNKNYNGSNQPVYIDVNVWNKMAEVVAQYLHKGSKVLVEGALSFQSWKDHKTDQNRSKISIVSYNIMFLDPKNKEVEEEEKPTEDSERSKDGDLTTVEKWELPF